jgi:ribosomal protein RSM22 (predicted rRNA methylase)
VGPCPHHGVCPMLANPETWCHFSQLTQRLPKSVFPKLPKDSDTLNEKFSYLIVKKGATPSTQFASESEAVSGLDKSYFWPRLIRPVLKKSKHLILDLCVPDGALERRIIAKSHGLEGGYRWAKRIRWGDLWYFEKRIPNKFRKEARFGKRLW